MPDAKREAMSHLSPLRAAAPVLVALVALSAVACGGAAAPIGSEQQPIRGGDGEPVGGEPGTSEPGEEPIAQCEAFPACDEGDEQVGGESGCRQDDATCYSRSMCGTTIWCTGEVKAQCAAYPSCDEGDKEVESASACLQDDAACYERSMCGATIWCTGPRAAK